MDMPAKLPTPAIIPTDLAGNTLTAGAAALVVGPGILDVVVAIDVVVDTGAEIEDDVDDGVAVRVTVTVGALLFSSIVSSETAAAVTACRSYLGSGIEDNLGEGVGVANRVGVSIAFGGFIALGVSKTLGVSGVFGVLTFGDLKLVLVSDALFSLATWTSGDDAACAARAGCVDAVFRSSSLMARPRLSGGGGAFRLRRANIMSDCWFAP